MNELPQAVIVTLRCSKTNRVSGIRFAELAPHNWAATWAFAIDETRLKKEGYDRGQIAGTIKRSETYPGCPHCHSRGILKCGKCGKVMCWDGETKYIACAWCGTNCEISGLIDKLATSGDG
jgi:hypothetical protein